MCWNRSGSDARWADRAARRRSRPPAASALLFLGTLLLSPVSARADVGILFHEALGAEAEGAGVPRESGDGRDQGRRENGGGAERRGTITDLEVEMNEFIARHLHLYQTKNRDYLTERFRRGEAHWGQVKSVLEEVGLPADLSNLAFLESGFNPFARSRAGAVGIWQFMDSTARLFGLEINWWVDERRDPEKSSMAAAAYLKQLYRIFQSWPLAIAAYNTGEDKVLEVLRRRPRADLWSLPLPRETWRLVSGFMALTLIVRDPEAYLFPAVREVRRPVAKVVVDSCTDLRVIARACEVPVAEILALNPELNWGCTPFGRSRYEVRIPASSKRRFQRAFPTIAQEERIRWTRHRVAKGDTLLQISRRYQAPAKMIAQMNHLPPSRAVTVGQEVLLPIPLGYKDWGARGGRSAQDRSL